MNYLKKFEGMKYTKYDFVNPNINENEPFWVSNSPLPEFSYIYEKGSTCVGLINILRRHLKLEIPGIITNEKKHEFPGGTSAWFYYLNKKNRLLQIDYSIVYPEGTLLLQNYNVEDQGHVAVLLTSNKLLESNIIHNVSGIWENKVYNSVVVEKLNQYPYYNRFTHICLPDNWLFRN